MTPDVVVNAIKEKLKEHTKLKNLKLDKVSINEITEILEIIEIEEANLFLKIGTPFLGSTICLVTFISSIIPVIFEKTDNRNGKLIYNIRPNFEDFEFTGDININFKITLLEFIWIIKFLKKKNDKQLKRRNKHDQSSYRGFDEYSYE